MKRGIGLAAALFLAAIGLQRAVSAPSADKPTAADQGVLAKAGKELFHDDFARSDMKPKWQVGKGFWTVKDGMATAAENPDDKHGAYAYAAFPQNFVVKDVVVEFQLKLDGARAAHLMINDNKYKESHAGHILKATIMPGKVNVADYKYGAMKNEIFEKMKDEKVSAEEKKQLRESIKDKSADFRTDAEGGRFLPVRVEIAGSEMLVSVDGKPAAYLKSEGIDHPTKNKIGFEISGKSVEIKDVKVFEAALSPEWAGKKEAVIQSLMVQR
jgi:hypothetical protein